MGPDLAEAPVKVHEHAALIEMVNGPFWQSPERTMQARNGSGLTPVQLAMLQGVP